MMGMGMAPLTPINDVQTCLTAVQSALMCIGAEHEDAVQYQNICTFGANYMRVDKDVDPGEVRRYMRCAQMSQNVAMQTIFNGMAGMPAPAAAPAADASADATAVSPAASPLPSTLNPMMMPMGGDDMGMDMESEDMMMGGMGGMTNPTMAHMAMMGGDGLDDNSALVASMMMQQAATTAADTAPAFVLRRPRRYRGMTPTTMVAGVPYRLEDSEDYATAARIKSYLATLPAGSQLNLANGMIDTDMFDDLFEGGMLPQMVSQAAAAAGVTTAASTTPTDASATAPAPCGSYKGLLPVDGIDQENMMMYPALVNDLVACFGPMAVNDGVNSDTVSMYAMRRGFAAPAAAEAAPADPAATSRLMKPRFKRAQRGRTPQYRRRYW